MMSDINEQLKFKPQIINLKNLNFDNVVIGGMGGSALPARAMFYLDPVYPLWLHSDYGLPKKVEGKTLFVAVSYSGDTTETISFAKEAYEQEFPVAIITYGGALKDFARGKDIPHALVPEGLQPRDALVYMLKSLLLILGKGELLEEIERVRVDSGDDEEIAGFISGGMPLIYSPTDSSALAYVWK